LPAADRLAPLVTVIGPDLAPGLEDLDAARRPDRRLVIPVVLGRRVVEQPQPATGQRDAVQPADAADPELEVLGEPRGPSGGGSP